VTDKRAGEATKRSKLPPPGIIKRPRLRDLGVAIGRFATGPHNAITDVSGVRVGHVTHVEGEGELVPGKGPVRTGVTAVIPASGNMFTDRVFAHCYVLNGAGEVTGLSQVQEWGLLETPILLTGTLCVGRVVDATISWLGRKYPEIGRTYDVVLPVVGECDDSYMNDALGRHISEVDVFRVLDEASGGFVAEGCVGAGTGMQSFNFAGGIGTSSRKLTIAGRPATVGALVLSNFGELELMRVDGVPVGRLLASKFSHLPKRPPAGSIIVLVATDVPLVPLQLSRICRRAALSLGRLGGYAANNSGEFVFAWSTSTRIPRERLRKTHSIHIVLDNEIDPLYEATVDVVEEAVLNAVCAGVHMTGHSGHVSIALPIDDVKQALLRHHAGVVSGA